MDPPDLYPRDPTYEEGTGWLDEIIDRLEQDPGECWPAFEGLSALDEEARTQVIEALARHRERPGVRELFRLLRATGDPANRSAVAIGSASTAGMADLPSLPVLPRVDRLMPEIDRRSARVLRSLVTAVDGEGRGAIVISASDGGSRRTAAFRCDVLRGILDVVGEVEEERLSAGRMIEEWIRQADGDYALDVSELAVRLLEGCRTLNGPEIPRPVQTWLDATIGPMYRPTGLSATLPGPEPLALPDAELSRGADLVLDACAGWLDRSPLTGELAREIALREGGGPDPLRDAGAYRYLFEHTLLGRLELYARMLLWMGWVWHADGRPELARPAFALAAQLSDEQYAVPSHPFISALMTRSLWAALTASPTGMSRKRAGEPPLP
jgi:hypothetical protein